MEHHSEESLKEVVFSPERQAEFGARFIGKKWFKGPLENDELTGLIDMYAQEHMAIKDKKPSVELTARLGRLVSYLEGNTWTDISSETGLDEASLIEEHGQIITDIRDRTSQLFNPPKRLNTSGLPEVQGKVLRLRYDRFGNLRMSQYEVAEWLDVSQPNVARAESKAKRHYLHVAATLYQAKKNYSNEEQPLRYRNDSLYLNDMIEEHARNFDIMQREFPDVTTELHIALDTLSTRLSHEEINQVKIHLGPNPPEHDFEQTNAACAALRATLEDMARHVRVKRPLYRHEEAIIETLLGNLDRHLVPIPREVMAEIFASETRALYSNIEASDEVIDQKVENYRHFLDRTMLRALERYNKIFSKTREWA